MASFLPLEIDSRILQSLNAFKARDHRQFAHTTAKRASKRSSGTVRPSSFNALIYASIASFTFVTASSLVFPLADATRKTRKFCHRLSCYLLGIQR
jgi:hypothetical protein